VLGNVHLHQVVIFKGWGLGPKDTKKNLTSCDLPTQSHSFSFSDHSTENCNKKISPPPRANGKAVCRVREVQRRVLLLKMHLLVSQTQPPWIGSLEVLTPFCVSTPLRGLTEIGLLDSLEISGGLPESSWWNGFLMGTWRCVGFVDRNNKPDPNIEGVRQTEWY